MPEDHPGKLPLPNERWDRYCQLRSDGLSKTEAGKELGYKAAYKAGHGLETKTMVLERIAYLTSLKGAEAVETREGEKDKLTKTLWDAVEGAKKGRTITRRGRQAQCPKCTAWIDTIEEIHEPNWNAVVKAIDTGMRKEGMFQIQISLTDTERQIQDADRDQLLDFGRAFLMELGVHKVAEIAASLRFDQLLVSHFRGLHLEDALSQIQEAVVAVYGSSLDRQRLERLALCEGEGVSPLSEAEAPL